MPLSVAEMFVALSKGKGATFGSITYRTKKTKEKAKYTVILGADTLATYRKDVVALKTMIPMLTGIDLDAAKELLESLEHSIAKMEKGEVNDRYALQNVRTDVAGVDHVWIHKETGALYLNCLVEDKETLEEGEPQKPVKSAPLTIAKNKIKKNFLRSGDIRTLCLERVNKLEVNGEVLEVEADD